MEKCNPVSCPGWKLISRTSTEVTVLSPRGADSRGLRVMVSWLMPLGCVANWRVAS